MPKVIEALRGRRVVAIAVGGLHSIVLTDEGEVLSFGAGSYGKLGHGDEVSQLVPKVIGALRDRRVVAIAAGNFHSMVLADKGAVLSFGKGKSGRLGHGDDSEDQREPVVIAGLRALIRREIDNSSIIIVIVIAMLLIMIIIMRKFRSRCVVCVFALGAELSELSELSRSLIILRTPGILTP